MGRSWRDVAGSTIAMSVLLRPPGWIDGRAGALSLAVAVAVASGLAPDARVAWPNDVLRRGRKVAGILLEAAWEGGSLSWVVVGIGINVRGVPDVPAGSWPVGALDQEGPVPPRGEVVAAVLVELARGYTRFCQAGTSEMIAALRTRDALAGRTVRVRHGGVVRVGTADGVEPDGSLRLRTEAGIETFAAAERLELVGG
jgi:BirA family biotin operon repressor/biotin-[acetyl-CoA-carboxylase] ligase